MLKELIHIQFLQLNLFYQVLIPIVGYFLRIDAIFFRGKGRRPALTSVQVSLIPSIFLFQLVQMDHFQQRGAYQLFLNLNLLKRKSIDAQRESIHVNGKTNGGIQTKYSIHFTMVNLCQVLHNLRKNSGRKRCDANVRHIENYVEVLDPLGDQEVFINVFNDKQC